MNSDVGGCGYDWVMEARVMGLDSHKSSREPGTDFLPQMACELRSPLTGGLIKPIHPQPAAKHP